MEGDILENLPTTVDSEPQESGRDAAAGASSQAATEKVAADPLQKETVAKPVDEKVGIASSGFQLPEGPRVDVSAATVARMMGIASTGDLRVLEGRIDLLTSKVAVILTKMDRCLSMFTSVPTASDIGRLEVQVAAVKSMIKEILDTVGAPINPIKERADREMAQEQSRKLREGIKTSSDS